VAAEVKRATGLDADLKVGNSGEFTIWLDDKLVAEKQRGEFPAPDVVVANLKKLLPG
jgi:hypothetical protein